MKIKTKLDGKVINVEIHDLSKKTFSDTSWLYTLIPIFSDISILSDLFEMKIKMESDTNGTYMRNGELLKAVNEISSVLGKYSLTKDDIEIWRIMLKMEIMEFFMQNITSIITIYDKNDKVVDNPMDYLHKMPVYSKTGLSINYLIDYIMGSYVDIISFSTLQTTCVINNETYRLNTKILHSLNDVGGVEANDTLDTNIIETSVILYLKEIINKIKTATVSSIIKGDESLDAFNRMFNIDYFNLLRMSACLWYKDGEPNIPINKIDRDSFLDKKMSEFDGNILLPNILQPIFFLTNLSNW